MREPLHLRTPLATDDQDCEFVELEWNRSLPSQVVQQVEHLLAKHRAAQHRIVWAAETNSRYLHDLLAERPLRVVELLHGQLRKARFFSRGHQGHSASAIDRIIATKALRKVDASCPRVPEEMCCGP